MKLLLISGRDAVSKTARKLTALVDRENLRIEGDGPSVTCEAAGGVTYIVIGRVNGKRGSADGILEPFELSPAGLLELSSVHSPADLAGLLEGRFVVLRVGADGAVTCCADRHGRADLFIQRPEGGVAVATDLTLLPENPANKGYDQAALAHALTVYGNRAPKKHTMYVGVRRLGIGETAEMSDGVLTVSATPFKPVPSAPFEKTDHERYAEAFLAHVEAAGSPDGNLLYLSSGWDSTGILAALNHVFGPGKTRAVTGRMTYSPQTGVCNQFEIDRAKAMTEFFGVELEFAELDYKDSGADWAARAGEYMLAYDFHNFTAVNHAVLADGASSHAKGIGHVFAGEISDGAHNLGFSQYATLFHPSYDFREYSDKMASYLFGPTFARQLLNGSHEQDAVFQFFKQRTGADAFVEADADAGQRLHQLLVSFFLRNARMPLVDIAGVRMLKPQGADRYTREMSETYLPPADALSPETLYSWYLHLYNSFHWQGSTVATLSVSADLVGLDAKLPYWDSALQNFLMQMPEDWGRGLDFNPTKYPLKHFLKNRVKYPYDLQTGPHSYTYDVDPTFNHQAELIYRSAYRGFLHDKLKTRPYHAILDDAWFDVDYIDGLVDDYLAGKEVGGSERSDLATICQYVVGGWF